MGARTRPLSIFIFREAVRAYHTALAIAFHMVTT